MNTKSSLSFAMATAALLVACSSESKSSTPAGNTSQQSLVKCEGVNECKGTSECKSATNPNGCQGLNDCKGQGWISIPQADCDKKGGKVLSEGSPAAGGNTSADSGSKDSGPMQASVKCEGINECKGHGDCAGEANGCKGQNECKGKGYVAVPSEAECLEKSGMVKA